MATVDEDVRKHFAECRIAAALDMCIQSCIASYPLDSNVLTVSVYSMGCAVVVCQSVYLWEPSALAVLLRLVFDTSGECRRALLPTASQRH